MKKTILFIAFILANHTAQSQKIDANQGWAVAIPIGTITEAGNDYAASTISPTAQTLIDFKTNRGTGYLISVQKIDIDWDVNLSLWVKRNGNGNGVGGNSVPMTGGETFIQLTNVLQDFFYNGAIVSRNRQNVPIQYKILGYSVLLPVKTYITTVVYTISD
ncbi:MAG: hypothetical protein U5L45_05615 [Saprospiraceae bacterium]|nr:hypothetical protein [Saprospiraceae bacterium]